MATIVEGNPKAPFSIATTPRCRGGRYSFPGLLYFTLDPYLIILSVKQGSIKYHFLSLWYDATWDWTQVSRAIGEHSNPCPNSFFFIQATNWQRDCCIKVLTTWLPVSRKYKRRRVSQARGSRRRSRKRDSSGRTSVSSKTNFGRITREEDSITIYTKMAVEVVEFCCLLLY